MISADNYYYVSEAIRAGYSSLPSKPTKTLLAKLFYYDCSTKKNDIVKEMNSVHRHPANLFELLAVGELYPHLQEQFPIVALDSVWYDNDGKPRMPALSFSDNKRTLGLGLFEDGFLGHFCFLGISN